MSETVQKLQPNRTIRLRGFDRRGAAAALHSASASGFVCSGVFRDQADFAVIDLYKCIDYYGHLDQRWIPDTDFSGVRLEFDMQYSGLQPIESPKHRWVAWDAIEGKTANGASSVSASLFDNATIASGSLGVASAAWTMVAGSDITGSELIGFEFNNLRFEVAPSGSFASAFDYYVGTAPVDLLTADCYALGSGTTQSVGVAGLESVVYEATDASPIVIDTWIANGLSNGDTVAVQLCEGNTAANGVTTVSNVSGTEFELDSTTGNGSLLNDNGRVGKYNRYDYVESGAVSGRDVAAGLAAAASGDSWVDASCVLGGAISDASNATPIKITTSTPHGLGSGNSVEISGVLGNTAANGAFIVTYVSDTEFNLDGSAGNGAYSGGGSIDKTNRLFVARKTGTEDTNIYLTITGGAPGLLSIGTKHYVVAAELSVDVTGASNTSPITITAPGHSLVEYDVAWVQGVGGNEAANVKSYAVNIVGDDFDLFGTTGDGDYTAGGKVGKREEFNYYQQAGDSACDIAAQIAASVSCSFLSATNVKASAITLVDVINSTSVAVYTDEKHGLSTGNAVELSGISGVTCDQDINSQWVIDVLSDYSFLLESITGASGSASSGTIAKTNRVFFNNTSSGGYDVVAEGSGGAGEITVNGFDLTSFTQTVVDAINQHDWYAEALAQAIMADNPSSDQVVIYAARYGKVDASGSNVSWVAPDLGYQSDYFTGIEPGTPIYIDGARYTVASVTDKENLTINEDAGSMSGVPYLAQRGGRDGNTIGILARSNSDRLYFQNATQLGSYWREDKYLTGGSSDVVWHIDIDFDATGLSADGLSQLWMTLAPELATPTASLGSEFNAIFSNWTVTSTSASLSLKAPNPGTVRVGARDQWVRRATDGWTETAGFYFEGYALGSSTVGDTVVVQYYSQATHDLYLNAELGSSGGQVGASLDGDVETLHDTYQFFYPPINGRVLLRSGVPAGGHVLTMRVAGAGTIGGTDLVRWDCIEAIVPGDYQAPTTTYSKVSAAIDYDTDHTYKLTPQEALWRLRQLGFDGDVNLYEGVFFWNQRRRVHGTNKLMQLALEGEWGVNDQVNLTISGVNVYKTLGSLDVDSATASVAPIMAVNGLASSINNGFIGVWADVVETPTAAVQIHMHSPTYTFPVSASISSSSGSFSFVGNLDSGAEGVWEVDDSADTALNYAARCWLLDFLREVSASGMKATVAYSMELMNPPEGPGSVWSSRFYDGVQVLTSTGFGTEASSTITDATNTSPIVITAEAHGYDTGDLISISGVVGNAAANNDPANPYWFVTVIDENTFSCDNSAGSGEYVSGGTALRNLRTAHCAFSPKMQAFQQKVYLETADLFASASLAPSLQFGEFLYWFFPRHSGAISDASDTSPIVITTNLPHGLSNGDSVIISGVLGNTAANGYYSSIGNVTTYTFELTGSTGSGAHTFGGRYSGGSMGYYDDETASAAVTALGRPLAKFGSSDDDPSLAASDVTFLQDRMVSHMSAIATYVKSAHPTAEFELLLPYDVNHPTAYWSSTLPYPQGGRLNNAVNIPPAFYFTGSPPMDKVLIEALSWGSFYRHWDRAKETQDVGTGLLGWPAAKVKYLLPVFNGGCPWAREYLYSVDKGHAETMFWAMDHFALFSRPLPLPRQKRRAQHV